MKIETIWCIMRWKLFHFQLALIKGFGLVKESTIIPHYVVSHTQPDEKSSMLAIMQ